MTEINEQEFLHYYADIQRKAVEGRATSGEMSQIKGRAKEAGVDVQILAVAAKFAKLDPVEYIAKLNRLMTYLGYLRLKGANQLSLIQNIDQTQPPSMQDHYDAGFAAAVNGQGLDACTLDVTMKAGKKWVEGYELGRSMLDGTNVVPMKPKLVVENGIEEPPPRIEDEPQTEDDPEPEDEVNEPPEDTPAFLTAKPKAKAAKAKPHPKPKAKAKAAPKPKPEDEEEEPEPEDEEEDVVYDDDEEDRASKQPVTSDLVSRLIARQKV
jgi:hypothetical protein